MKDLLLSREELDKLENNPIFVYWLYGGVDENRLNEEEKQIIISRQMYYDLVISDDRMIFVLERLDCQNYDSLIEDKEKLSKASFFLGQREDIVKTKVLLMKKRKEKEKVLKMKEN